MDDRQIKENSTTHPIKFKLAKEYVNGESKHFLEYFESEEQAKIWLEERNIKPDEVINWDVVFESLPTDDMEKLMENNKESIVGVKFTEKEMLELAHIGKDNDKLSNILRKKLVGYQMTNSKEHIMSNQMGNLLSAILNS